MQLKEIVKQTLVRIQKAGLNATPDVYAKYFCELTKKEGTDIPECRPASKYVELLAPEIRKDAKNRKIDQLEDLAMFLTGHLNRRMGVKPQEAGEENVAPLVSLGLVPSFSRTMMERIRPARLALKSKAFILKDPAEREKLATLIKERVHLDRSEILEHTDDLEATLNTMLRSLAGMMNGDDAMAGLAKAVDQAKREELTIETFQSLKAKMETVAATMQERMAAMYRELDRKKVELTELSQQVRTLHKDLSQAQKESREDFLTGLPTRRALDEKLAEAEKAYEADKTPYSLVFFDLDKFKSVNDTYGHDAGDKVLQTFGKILAEKKPENGFAARNGGEEFVLYLPTGSRDEALAAAEMIRKAVEDVKFDYSGTTIPVTVSGGVAIREWCADALAAIQKADANLYQAKTGGRNRIVADEMHSLEEN